MAKVSDAERVLRKAGLRVTRPRIAVFAAVGAHPHADTTTILGLVRRDLPAVSLQAVYDGLNTLTGAGLLRRIQPQGSPARYETRTKDNHHHLVCRRCEAVVDVDCAVGAAPCLTPSDHGGFCVDEAEVIYWGICPDCSANDRSPRQ